MSMQNSDNIWNRPVEEDIEIVGIKFHFERDGALPCNWTKIRLLRYEKEVYRLELDRTSAVATNDARREYFDGREFRQYTGNQPSFFEYCDALQNDPSKIGKTGELAKILNLDRKIVEGYSKFMQEQLKK